MLAQTLPSTPARASCSRLPGPPSTPENSLPNKSTGIRLKMSVVQRCFPSLICEQSVAIRSWHTIRDGHKFRTCKKQFSDNRRRRSWRTMPVLFAPQIRPQKNQLSATATSRRSHHRWPDRPFESTPRLAPRRSRDRRAPGKALRAFPKCNWDGVHNARNRDDPIFHRPNGHDVPDVRSSTFASDPNRSRPLEFVQIATTPGSSMVMRRLLANTGVLAVPKSIPT